MIRSFLQALGLLNAVDIAALRKSGAWILDVRTKGEFNQGHISGAMNIPLNELPRHLDKLKKNIPLITCCASGMRSAQARRLLKSNGFKEVYNGGGWKNLETKWNKN